jgi:hypothetical protein
MVKNLDVKQIQSAIEKSCGRIYSRQRIMQLAVKWGGLVADRKNILIKPEISDKIIEYLTLSAQLRQISGAKK